MDIKKIILFKIRERINLKEKMIAYFFRRYTFKIYKMGYNDGYNFKDVSGCKKAEKLKIIKMQNINSKS